jgi:hypothetical protein
MMVIALSTMLGLTVPPSTLFQVDEVIRYHYTLPTRSMSGKPLPLVH